MMKSIISVLLLVSTAWRAFAVPCEGNPAIVCPTEGCECGAAKTECKSAGPITEETTGPVCCTDAAGCGWTEGVYPDFTGDSKSGGFGTSRFQSVFRKGKKTKTETHAKLSVADFNAQSAVVAGWFTQYKAAHAGGPVWVGEGTVPLFCMSADDAAYNTALGKAAPGDIDLATPGDVATVGNQISDSATLADATNCKFKYYPGALKVIDAVFMSNACPKASKIMLDIHKRTEVTKYCICDSRCAGLPLLPLDVVKTVYTANAAVKNGQGKADYAQTIMTANGGKVCGSCTEHTI